MNAGETVADSQNHAVEVMRYVVEIDIAADVADTAVVVVADVGGLKEVTVDENVPEAKFVYVTAVDVVVLVVLHDDAVAEVKHAPTQPYLERSA